VNKSVPAAELGCMSVFLNMGQEVPTESMAIATAGGGDGIRSIANYSDLSGARILNKDQFWSK
jgi:hypothetical protein